MAFDFDWTPLGAVGQAAIRAGRNMAARTEMQMGATYRGQNLADARARDELKFRKEQADRGFQLQLADAGRRSRELDMRAMSMGQESAQFQEARKSRDQNLADWEAIRDRLDPAEYSRGLIAIRGGKIPPQLNQVRSDAQTELDQLKEMDKMAQVTGYAAEVLEGYYRDDDGVWRDGNQEGMEKIWPGVDKVTDPTKITELNQSEAIINKVKEAQAAATAGYKSMNDKALSNPDLAPEERIRMQVQSSLESLSEPQKEVHLALIAEYTKITNGDPYAAMQMYLKDKAEAEEAELAKFMNNNTEWGY